LDAKQIEQMALFSGLDMPEVLDKLRSSCYDRVSGGAS
jgi:hypothetical protein